MLSVLTEQKQAQRRALYFIITGLAERDKAFGAISHSAKGGRGWYILRATPTASWTASKMGSCAGPARAIVIVLGDFGFVWDGSKAEQKSLDWLRKRPYTILFLDGSHENYDLLEQYPTEERFGGLVQPLGGNVYHVCRGSVLELEGKKYLCFGGAESPDKEEREVHVNWWPQEMPSDEEYARCEAALEANGWQVDYVLTHDAPSKFLDFSVLAEGENNRLHLFLDKVVMKTTYEKWFFGCHHKDVQLSTKSRCLFCDVVSIGEKKPWWKRR